MVSRKRVTSACQQCQQRKRRCDGAEPCCNYCKKHGRHCVYTKRRWRGPGKSKEPNRPLMQQNYQVGSSSGPDLARILETNEARGYNELSGAITAQVSREGGFTEESIDSGSTYLTKLFKGPNNPRLDSMNDSNQSPWVASETTGTLPSAAKQFTAFSDTIREAIRQMQIKKNEGCFEKKIFTSLPFKDLILDFMEPVIEEIQLHGVFLTKESALKRLTEQYIAGVDDCYSDPGRWATVCSLIGTSVLHRTASGSLATMSSMAWAFFKNSFAMYAELAIRGPEMFTCEALLAMILFMLRTGDACVTAQLTATAARSMHMLGLHNHEHYIDLDADVAESQKRIFWVTYIVNADVTHTYGLPSPLRIEDVVIGFPGHEHHVFTHTDHFEDNSQQQQTQFLRHRAVLAVAQLRIHGLLQQVLSRPISKRKSSDLLEAIKASDEELEVWKRSLPINIQPGLRSSGMPPLEMPVASLHYIYFSCISKVSMAAVLLSNGATYNSVSQEEGALTMNTTFPSSGIARARCAMAARGTLDVLLRLQPQPFPHLWQTLCFPLSAVLILLSEILSHPASVQAEVDAQLIYDFVRYLERLQKEGSDVHRLIDGCNKFHSIATCALSALKPGEQTNIFGNPVQVQSLHLRLAQVVDWLQLAQGLLSNMPALCSKAREVFCDILDPPRVDETYGAFVPDFLKSHKYGFSFSN